MRSFPELLISSSLAPSFVRTGSSLSCVTGCTFSSSTCFTLCGSCLPHSPHPVMDIIINPAVSRLTIFFICPNSSPVIFFCITKMAPENIIPKPQQGQKDSNPRHLVLETNVLPTELYPCVSLTLSIIYHNHRHVSMIIFETFFQIFIPSTSIASRTVDTPIKPDACYALHLVHGSSSEG